MSWFGDFFNFWVRFMYDIEMLALWAFLTMVIVSIPNMAVFNFFSIDFLQLIALIELRDYL